MNVPANRIEVITNVPCTAQIDLNEEPKFIVQDEWAFHAAVFYAHDRQKLPPRDWNRRNHNEWSMLIHERNRYTLETRVIYIAPEYTTDGRIKRVHVMLGPPTDPKIPAGTVQQFRVEEWPLKPNKVKDYGHFYHCDLSMRISSPDWEETYLYNIPPFDSNQFCINFAHFFHNVGLIDKSDVRYLKNMTRTPWPRPDGSNLPYKI